MYTQPAISDGFGGPAGADAPNEKLEKNRRARPGTPPNDEPPLPTSDTEEGEEEEDDEEGDAADPNLGASFDHASEMELPVRRSKRCTPLSSAASAELALLPLLPLLLAGGWMANDDGGASGAGGGRKPRDR
jgi:hypothetical protein